MLENFDFIAVGDTTTDAFIKIKQANIYKDGQGEEKLCVENGAKIPYESVTVVPAVGNSPNAAVTARRLGLKSALVTNMGNDRYGDDCVLRLKENGIALDFVKQHEKLESNYHFVLWFRAERTILIKHHEYPYALPDIGVPRFIYLSSLGEHSADYHKQIADYLKKNPSVKLAFQPGTFQIKLGYDALKDIYEKTEVFFCNKEEAQIILSDTETDISKLARLIYERGPKIAVITDGPKGAYVYDGTNDWFMPPYPDPKPPFERTGAGDAFASTFASALALGKTLEEALMWAPINSMSVVQYIGAQEGLVTQAKLEEYLKNAPEHYRAKKL